MKEWTKPRTIFATMFYVAFIYLVITSKLDPKAIENLSLMLMAYYFGQKTKESK